MNLMDVIAKAKAEKATSLDLSQQDLRILPKELFDIESLEELNLDRNKLVELPDELGQLKNLKSLSVSENDQNAGRAHQNLLDVLVAVEFQPVLQAESVA